jgi:hypothetical protein
MGCALGFAVNAALLAQILYYALIKEKMSLANLYTSDFRSAPLQAEGLSNGIDISDAIAIGEGSSDANSSAHED